MISVLISVALMAGEQRKKAFRSILMRLAVAGFSAGNVMMVSVSLYAGYFQGMERQYRIFFEAMSGLLSLPALFYSAIPFWEGARQAIRFRHPNMDLLISFGLSITFTYSVVALVTQSGAPYFDSVATLVFFLLIGRALEQVTRTQVSQLSERLLSLTPQFALRLGQGGEESTVSVEELEVGNRVRIRSGETVPTDGVVESGESEVDESALTGESQWRYVGAGDLVLAGSLNQNGSLVVQVQSTGGESLLQKMAALVEQASQQKTRLQRLADRIAGWFVWLILILAMGSFGFWTWWGTPPEGKSAWMIAVSVLIIACSCALSLATPTAILAAVQQATRRGWLVKINWT